MIIIFVNNIKFELKNYILYILIIALLTFMEGNGIG